MEIAILIKINNRGINESYETFDTFIKTEFDDEELEEKIMNKYPSLLYVHNNCYDGVIHDSITKETYLIVKIIE
jgi:hypothetical protein